MFPSSIGSLAKIKIWRIATALKNNWINIKMLFSELEEYSDPNIGLLFPMFGYSQSCIMILIRVISRILGALDDLIQVEAHLAQLVKHQDKYQNQYWKCSKILL
jgi:hypothetical protein